MSHGYGNCSLCGKEILISITNADWHPAIDLDTDKPICEECYLDHVEDFNLLKEGDY